MGLEVDVFANIRKADNEENCSFTAFVIADRWKHKIKNLEEGCAYNGDIVASCADYSYGVHMVFREYLVKLTETDGVVGPLGIEWENLRPEMPFYNLIDFADNEGCFDWDTAKIILDDFDKYAEKNEQSTITYYPEKYKEWHIAMKAAVDHQGVVVFQ